MKKLLVVVVALAATNAFATRARVNALGNSPHLMDTQTVYSNPADMMMMGDYVTMESGSSSATSADRTEGANTEGMITRSWGDAKMGLALGHQSKLSSTWGLRSSFIGATSGIRSQQNPVELSYGMKTSDMAWAATLVYSNMNDKTATAEKESSAGIRAGLRMGALDAKLGLGLMNTYESAAQGKYKGTMGLSAGAGYAMDSLYVSGSVALAGFKTEDAAGTETGKFNSTDISVSAVNSHKKDGSEFFYGAGLDSVSQKWENTSANDAKVNNLALPIWLGMEVDAASWLTLRASVKQSTLVLNQKTEVTGTVPVAFTAQEFAPGANTTTAAVGAGLKWNKVTLDGSLGSVTAQQINGTSLLGTVGMTYMF
jgi:hypothetical protein